MVGQLNRESDFAEDVLTRALVDTFVSNAYPEFHSEEEVSEPRDERVATVRNDCLLLVCKSVSGLEPRGLSVVKLYNRVCETRVLGEAYAGLLDFARAFGGPRETASGPEDPGHELVNEYTLWHAVRGIERCKPQSAAHALRGSRGLCESEQRVCHTLERVSRVLLRNRHNVRHVGGNQEDALVLPLHPATRKLRIRMELEQLEWLKRRDEIAKQNALGKEISHQLASYSHRLEVIEAPASTASTGTNDRLFPYVCMAVLDPVRRYSARYNMTAERVMLFKHLVALGLSVDTSSILLKSVLQARRGGMIGSPLVEGVER
ncbi:hypothetical protein Q5P01_016575 [Channa striata]|uniref:Uncharacterized protein n=1 Tax=Channa striata TaxID=64152 RepID=A0AA88SCL7_CHASR|nr:hypothetical protein Q5P01_016575 [Channa striata]